MTRIFCTVIWVLFFISMWNMVVDKPEAAGVWFAKARQQYIATTGQ
jgi:hypothetical protein